MREIEYEVVVESEDADRYSAIILKIDGQEFQLDKNDVAHLEGVIDTVFDRMIYPFDAYLRKAPPVRVKGTTPVPPTQ